MNILITGGAGFLGLHLVKYFERENANITLIDIAKYDPTEYSKRHRLLTIDVRKKYLLEKAVKGQDYIIHAAAGLPLWSHDDIISTNVEGTKNILSLARKHKVKRTIYISSTAVYGVPKKHPVYENDPLVGVGPYGHSKIEAEKACWRAIKQGVPVTIIRPKTFVGTGRLGVFEILFDWIHDGKRIPVIGSGNNRYQLLDVDDLVEAIGLVIETKSRKLNDVFNVGAQEFQTVRQDLEALFAHAKSNSKLLPTPALPIKAALFFFEKIGVSPLYQWVYDTADKDSFVSIEKIMKTVGWKPKYSNAQALIKAYDWYLKHYKEVKQSGSGITHRVGWDQGVLKLFKKFL
ncbi:MAG: epimerase [Microgenomates group bacterium GW2011_GWC1_41_8]|uniref:Nucleoside-diphosphate-sugar epimerase n=1 Tax=Candidatus Roizmanbacteria bacterium GW2011_GWC2_41_7 TaxID=1618487 RepID=A0A0G0XER2_9BACT|nr:MAG: Nucleoside-diphosphate-sugar epimerase [Candidatus Levybacteria bacterium GW2011_GWA2_40_16]KKS22454.1 MAG: epimerase [Microgenomates group bacterium GW2011_GWC1_41_8]KKS22927.1 MAG: Nucleoside-diphosphate-sugar epimerase [Candidatus Roizmanbacteria bacterium GW2011_GWC2_41_7]